MNILVTGGAGFIGSHVADALIKAGHRAVIVDNLHTGHLDNVPAQATFYAVDIRDAERLERIYVDEQIEAISHQAALANVRASMQDPASYAAVNVIGTLNLLEIAHRRGCARFVFATTGGAVYGEGQSADGSRLPFTEQSWPRPKDNYGANKLSAEFHVDLYHQNYGLCYAALRYPNVYGPRQDSEGEAGVVAIFAGAMLARQPTRITGDGEQTRDFCYVGDIARANLLAMTGSGVGIYNVGTGVPTTVRTVHSILSRLTDYPWQPDYVPQPTGEVRATYLDSSKARRDLGWEPQMSLEAGLEQVVSWMRSNGATER